MGYVKFILSIAIIGLPLLTVYAQIRRATPLVVTNFYNGIEKMGCCKSTSELGELEVSMTRCFFRSEESGVELPNDFKFFDQDKHSISHNLDILTSNNYVNKLSEYIAQKKILYPRIKISTYSEEGGFLPTMQDMKISKERAWIRTIVRKCYSFKGGGPSLEKEFIDTVYTHTKAQKIRMISNGNGIMPTNNIEHLRIEASKAYEKKDYKKAYEIIKRISELNARGSESFFRLAVMTFYGKGVRQNRHEALELMRKSAYNNNDEYAIKARTVVNHWQNNQVIF